MCLVEKFLVDVSGETKVTNPHLQLFVHKYVSGCQVTMYYVLLRDIPVQEKEEEEEKIRKMRKTRRRKRRRRR